MNRTRLALVVFLAATALAGCNALSNPGDADAPGNGSGALTPASVPTTAAALPPGVTDRGVGVATLASAHTRALSTRSYTVVVSQRAIGPNGTVATLSRHRRVAADTARYVGGYNRTVRQLGVQRQTQRVAYWGNESGFATRLRLGASRTYYDWSDSGTPVLTLDESRALRSRLSALSLRVADRTDEGVVLVATDLAAPGRFPTPTYAADPHNVTTTLEVRLDGVVTAWRLAYDARAGDTDIRVVREFRLTDVGNTTVDRPAWVETATTEQGP